MTAAAAGGGVWAPEAEVGVTASEVRAEWPSQKRRPA